MVENPGAQARSGAIKLLNQPEPVHVIADQAGNPVSVSVRRSLPPQSEKAGRRAAILAARSASRISRMHAVQSIDDRWKVNDEWWRGSELEIERMYYSLLLDNGRRVVVYRDMKSDCWYRQASR